MHIYMLLQMCGIFNQYLSNYSIFLVLIYMVAQKFVDIFLRTVKIFIIVESKFSFIISTLINFVVLNLNMLFIFYERSLNSKKLDFFIFFLKLKIIAQLIIQQL